MPIHPVWRNFGELIIFPCCFYHIKIIWYLQIWPLYWSAQTSDHIWTFYKTCPNTYFLGSPILHIFIVRTIHLSCLERYPCYHRRKTLRKMWNRYKDFLKNLYYEEPSVWKIPLSGIWLLICSGVKNIVKGLPKIQ